MNSKGSWQHWQEHAGERVVRVMALLYVGGVGLLLLAPLLQAILLVAWLEH